jgi:hypothetical protein
MCTVILKFAPVVLISVFVVSSLSCAIAAPPAKRPPAVNLTGSYNAYLNKLRAKILSSWSPAEGKNKVILQAVVGNDGSVSDLTLKSTPPNPQAEESANAAFAQAQPLEPLPANSPNARITLTFDSFSDPHGDSSANLGTRMDPITPPKLQPAAAAGQ